MQECSVASPVAQSSWAKSYWSCCWLQHSATQETACVDIWASTDPAFWAEVPSWEILDHLQWDSDSLGADGENGGGMLSLLKTCRKAQGNPQLQDSSWTGNFGAEDRNTWYGSWMARRICAPSVSLLAPAAADGQQCIPKAVSPHKSSSGSLVIIRFISSAVPFLSFLKSLVRFMLKR